MTLELKRFWSKVEMIPFHPCWEWTAAKKDGYGRFNDKGYAHRISYEMHFGPIPKGFLVCHKCDNPSCVNPEHLFLGTYQDNYDDMRKKKRESKPPLMAGWNKKEISKEIKNLLGTMSDDSLAKKANVNKSTIARIRKKLLIKSYAETTGESGRFNGKGPHPRWHR
mgnify:CR=1 FL=1